MGYRIRIEPSAEEILLDEMITSVASRLAGLDDGDPAAQPLREHLAELEARRDQKQRAQEDEAYARNKVAVWVFLVFGVLGAATLITGLAELAGSSQDPLAGKVAMVISGTLLGPILISLAVASWLDIRQYRRSHDTEPR